MRKPNFLLFILKKVYVRKIYKLLWYFIYSRWWVRILSFNGIKIAYRGLSPMIANTHWEFSWPCQLQKFVGNDMTVRNYGKCGFGNERIYRKTHEIINKPDFKQKNIYFYLSFLMLVERSFTMLTWMTMLFVTTILILRMVKPY